MDCYNHYNLIFRLDITETNNEIAFQQALQLIVTGNKTEHGQIQTSK